ncbi:response regulator [Paenibacillus sp. OV219]|uniref:response regulator n=1 Tax=Paenibacillus sp. OV219 TaxID=1884377 RepID=UPI0008B4D738|nr:response regulator [Paenibacillus sp. OV219]SEO40602.1 two-component system, unclassified family, sensor histidine kinase and response regulator [Paenibacillus sp. OV219]
MGSFSLRTKVLVLILFVTSGALSIVGYGNYTLAKQTIMDTLVEKANAKVQNTANDLASWIETRRAEVEVMSRTDQVRFGSDNQREIYFSTETHRPNSPYVSLGFADLTGRMHLPNSAYINILDEPSFTRAIRGNVVVTDPMEGRQNKTEIIVIQVPVFGVGNKVIGVVDASLLADRMYQEHLNIHVGANDSLFLYNDNARIIEASMKLPSQSIHSAELPFQSVASDMLVSDYGYDTLHGPSGASILFYAAIKGTSWHIALNVPLDDIGAPLKAIKWRAILTIAIAEALLTILFFLFSDHIIRRIKRILQVTEAAAAGRFDVNNVNDDSGDEISQLAQSVNQMKVHLSGLFGRMDAIINQNQFAFIVLDDQYRVTYFSKAAEKMLGYKSEEVINKATALLFIAPEDVRRESKRLSNKFNRHVPPDITVFEMLRSESFSYEREWNYIRKDGTSFPVAHSSNGMSDREGRFIGVAGIARDITGQKQAEKARSQQLKVMGAAKDLIATFDDQGQLLYINAAGRVLLGIHDSHSDTDPMPMRTIGELLDGIDDARTVGFQEKEVLLRTIQGAFIPVSKILVVHHDDQTGETFYSCIARDISETKRVQLELEQARGEAVSANLAKSHFLAQISHEIRTPLAGIIGLTGLLQKTELTSLQLEYLHKTRDSSEALLLIINDILDFAKVEAGKIELDEVPFDPYSMIHKLSELLSVFVGGKERFQFIVETPNTLPSLLIGDWLRMEQILLNLCINAIKFTERGHVRLQVQLLQSSKPGGDAMVAFIVEDTGIGMKEEQLAKLFKPFMQADAATNRKYGGTGLGLVIVKRLVELMGGTIQVQSEYGKGSQFTVVLDLAVAEEAQSDRFRIDRSDRSGEHSVWVVEDYAPMSQRLCVALEDSGLTPIPLNSWKVAHERLLRSGIGVRPFAVLLDFEMPDMYGEETWNDMQAAAKDAGVKTIALTTAYGREELLKLPLEHRPDAILVKPATRVSLNQMLLTLFPREEQPVAEADVEAAAALALLPKQTKGTILLAEDNHINQLVAVEQLREWGFKVDVVETGTEVLKRITTKRYDLILMDIHMPEMDGDDAARIIRQDSKYDRLPIVALTANIIQEDHDRYMQLGMNDVLTKPIPPDKLLQIITKWLRYGGELRVDQAKSKPKERDSVATAYMPVQALDDEWLAKGIKGLNLEEALQRVNGKKDILTHMLKLFVKDYSTFDERLAEALEGHDYTLARRMAHTLKGVASNLSAAKLAMLAQQLEQQLKATEPDLEVGLIYEAAATVSEELRQIVSRLVTEMTEFDTKS